MLVGIAIAFACQYDLAPQRFDRFYLELWRGHGHDDNGAGAQLAATQCHALGVVAGRCANHAALELLRRELRHFVVGTTQLEAEYRLLILALEQHGVVQSAAQVFG